MPLFDIVFPWIYGLPRPLTPPCCPYNTDAQKYPAAVKKTLQACGDIFHFLFFIISVSAKMHYFSLSLSLCFAAASAVRTTSVPKDTPPITPVDGVVFPPPPDLPLLSPSLPLLSPSLPLSSESPVSPLSSESPVSPLSSGSPVSSLSSESPVSSLSSESSSSELSSGRE